MKVHRNRSSKFIEDTFMKHTDTINILSEKDDDHTFVLRDQVKKGEKISFALTMKIATINIVTISNSLLGSIMGKYKSVTIVTKAIVSGYKKDKDRLNDMLSCKLDATLSWKDKDVFGGSKVVFETVAIEGYQFLGDVSEGLINQDIEIHAFFTGVTFDNVYFDTSLPL